MDTASEQQIAIEQRRTGLLRAMGIEPLISVVPAVNARPLPRLALPQPAMPVPQAKPSNVTPPMAKRPASQARPEVAKPEPAKAEAAAQAAPPFSELVACAGGWIWLEHLADRLVRKEQLELIQAMGRAMDHGAPKMVYQQFDWPLIDHPQVPRDLETSKQSLSGLIARLGRGGGKRGILLLGEEVEQYIVKPGVAKLPSTLAMLDNAELKKAAWAIMKPLRS